MIDVINATPSSVIALGGMILTVLGGVVGAIITARTKDRSTSVEARKAEVDAANRMIDQLQEELVVYRAGQEQRMTTTDERMTALELRNGMLVDRADRYRDLLYKHRSHIWDGKPPPPPEWPEDLPR